MKLTTRSRYGTRMMLDIAIHCKDGLVRISDIADRQGLSIKYLEKLIKELKRAGFIYSKRGPGGGHTLAMNPEVITIGAIVRSLEGNSGIVECLSNDIICERFLDCPTHGVWQKASEAMYEALDNVSVSDLIQKNSFCVKNIPL